MNLSKHALPDFSPRQHPSGLANGKATKSKKNSRDWSPFAMLQAEGRVSAAALEVFERQKLESIKSVYQNLSPKKKKIKKIKVKREVFAREEHLLLAHPVDQ
eukprot:CAMPEP_0202961784 /NCGR_PEP_ID=MMETSP1396-20130829/5862_1 /ASSEMBLY_ACC=CAM_ASM_000872 /TAXON_ID= /ORGANISM="Pseudokeronopsis sp., Strain Brazil" /LENGTH=101 /DNA_ID=CAMNT_0049681871 /DNA_START=1216 /DNA_END=1521 /DNA_ORIENTATION=-